MLDRKEILILALTVSLVGISSLYVITAQNPSESIDLNEVNEDLLGSRVKTEGYVSDMRWYGQTVLIELEENETSLTIVTNTEILDKLEKEEERVERGSKIQIEGNIEEYDGEIQARVDSIEDIELKKRSFYGHINISELLENPEWYEGVKVTVRGRITNLRFDEDGTKMIDINSLDHDGYRLTSRCDLELIENLEDLKGNPVVIEGRLFYESEIGSWVLHCESELEIKADS